MASQPSTKQLDTENQELRARLEKAEATLREVLSGEADAMFVSGVVGGQLFTLKGADQSYRALIENMSEGAITLAPEGLILYANLRFAEMLRTPLEKVIGSEIHHWFAPKSRQVILALLQKEAINNYHEELNLVVADGTEVPVYLSVSRLVLDEIDSVCMVVTDLTEQKRNEAILAAEKLSNEILEQAADAIIICNESGRIIRASKQAQALYGKSPLGQLFDHAFPLRQMDGTAFSAASAINTNGSQSVESKLEHNGRAFDLMVSVGHLRGARDELVGSVVTLTDITERKLAEKEIQSISKFAAENPSPVLRIQRNGTILYANHSAAPLLTTWGVDVGQKVSNDLQKSNAETFESGINKEVEIKCNRQIFSCILTPILAEEYVNIYGRDITEGKKAEASIKYLNRVLSVLSGINSLIVREHDRDELFREACNIAVEEGGFLMAMLVIVDPVTKLPVSVTSAGKHEELLADVKNLMSTSEGMQSSLIGQAIRESKAVISNDSQNDPRLVFGKQYTEAGVNSMSVLPLIISTEAVGTIALYASEIEFFQKDEMKLLSELAGDIAFAIDHIEKQERLNYLAYYDVLTGLANRTLFLERVAQYMRSAERDQHKLAIGLIDLERFKSINDSLGRPTGDMLLKQVAQWLSHNAGDANLLARIDADHFAIVLPEVKSDTSLAKLVDNLMAAFLGHRFPLDDVVLRLRIKVGIAIFPDDGSDADTLFMNAEAALKKAKQSGDRYLFHTQKMTESVAGKLTLENQLRQAIDNEEFVLHYQPKVNLVSGKVTGAEALIRWNDPRTGLVPPGMFIPVLEETGLIHEVGRWALHKAIADNMRWRAAGLDTVRIAVNVSPLQLRNINFIDEIRQVISIDEHTSAGLELEITESVIMNNIEFNITTLQAIRAMGITIAIDDFGTGFSSLSYLAKLPVDTLKIDRSFVIAMTTGSEGLSLVSTIISLAHALKLKVVAEGVETEEQSRLLRLLDCDEMQGFLFSKPVPAEIFEIKFLAAVTVDH